MSGSQSLVGGNLKDIPLSVLPARAVACQQHRMHNSTPVSGVQGARCAMWVRDAEARPQAAWMLSKPTRAPALAAGVLFLCCVGCEVGLEAPELL